MHKESSYKKKTVAVVGLSTEGIDTVKFLNNEDAIITCCDRRNKSELGEIYKILSKYKVNFSLGPTYLDNLEKFDLIVRTPGAALFLPQLINAKKRGQMITSQTKIFFDEVPCPIIGVTGTKGKGTTVSLIGVMLKKSGFKTYIGGNIGQPLLSKVRNISTNDKVVLELSSFQLEDLTTSPHISVILNITQEHLNNMDPLSSNFHASRAVYISAKENLVKYQKFDDFCVINADFEIPKSFAKLTKAKTYWFSKNKAVEGAYVNDKKIWLNINGKTQEIVSVDQVLLRGVHNWENIMAAAISAFLAGATIESIRQTCLTFKGLEYRLELIRDLNGVKFYNDSFSTTPETTIAAIRAFHEHIILICGGSDKGSDFTELGEELLTSNVKTLILIGMMAPKIEAAIDSASKKLHLPLQMKIIKNLTNMKNIVTIAYQEANAGEIILLSPACASFDMFKNYKDRGNQFNENVYKLPEKK